jgi:fibro-slime domain-containing protein
VSPPSDSCASYSASETSGFSLPIIYRDFIGADQGGHSDFESFPEAEVQEGIVDVVLGANGPRFAGQSGVGVTSADSFASWFTDDTAFNIHINDTLNVTASQGMFNFDSDRFFPIDDKAQVALARETKRSNEECGGQVDEAHNFSFTSELRFWFDYTGMEEVTFEGDDDAWIFVNNRLVIDLGGVHDVARTDPPFTLTDDAVDTRGTSLALEVGARYELAVFHAERRSCGSNYALRLSQFKIVKPNCK